MTLVPPETPTATVKVSHRMTLKRSPGSAWPPSRADAGAQFNLGWMYASGRGVPQDDVTAHMWLNVAAATGHEQARKNRDSVAANMTREQIAEAQARARDWVNR